MYLSCTFCLAIHTTIFVPFLKCNLDIHLVSWIGPRFQLFLSQIDFCRTGEALSHPSSQHDGWWRYYSSPDAGQIRDVLCKDSHKTNMAWQGIKRWNILTTCDLIDVDGSKRPILSKWSHRWVRGIKMNHICCYYNSLGQRRRGQCRKNVNPWEKKRKRHEASQRNKHCSVE